MSQGENIAELHRTRKKFWHETVTAVTATGRHPFTAHAAGRSASVKIYMCTATEQGVLSCVQVLIQWIMGMQGMEESPELCSSCQGDVAITSSLCSMGSECGRGNNE